MEFLQVHEQDEDLALLMLNLQNTFGDGVIPGSIWESLDAVYVND